MARVDTSVPSWPDRIRALRQALGGLTQQELADRMNVMQYTVSNWETGKREPQGAAVRLVEILERVAREKGAG